ncbi:unnamed protein product [Haemonchus placei]|uniref:G_PROTEIN_RECEP_F1_2 domain-containing protein n=1 Tax=Haemonchus placei TaxID=6290 RepID=A0A0N4WMC2_HAEPC|nr:unnamed protein product [Haemonchus placei]
MARRVVEPNCDLKTQSARYMLVRKFGFDESMSVSLCRKSVLKVFSTATAFYIPLIAIIVVYWKILRAAKKRFKRERDRRTVIRPPPEQSNTTSEKLAPLILKKNKKSIGDSSTSTQSEEDRTISHNQPEQETKLDDHANHQGNGKLLRPMIIRKKRRSKETAENKRERKAWRTLAIITGTFVACWTPFFLVSLYRPICRCTIPRPVETVTAWLGYLNSALNPIIYTVFSQDFRAAFKKIIRRLCLLKEY